MQYLQYNAITGATLNSTIFITYFTKQCDYLLNLQYQFRHYLQSYTITYATYILYYDHEQQNKRLYDYLLNLRYQFIHYLQNYTITYATYIRIITMNNKIKDYDYLWGLRH